MSKISQLERNAWEQARAAGKDRFILRGIFGDVLIWLGVVVVLTLSQERSFWRPEKSSLLADLILLPIFLLGGILRAIWQWQDLERKYPKDQLPPWE
jgi:hypothetical protein